MKTVNTIAAAAVIAASIACAASANAAPSGNRSADDLIIQLQQGNAVVNPTASHPLSQSTVTSVRPDKTHPSYDSGHPVAPDDPMTQVVSTTVSSTRSATPMQSGHGSSAGRGWPDYRASRRTDTVAWTGVHGRIPANLNEVDNDGVQLREGDAAQLGVRVHRGGRFHHAPRFKRDGRFQHRSRRYPASDVPWWSQTGPR